MGSSLSHIIFQPPKSPTYLDDGHFIWLHTRKEAMHAECGGVVVSGLGSIIPSCYINRGAHFTVLFSHGNAEDLGMVLRYWKEMAHTINVNVFAYE